MQRILTIDFETHDPHLKRHGAGWAFKCNFPSYEFDILGAAYVTHEGEQGYIVLDVEYEHGIDPANRLQKLLDSHDALLCHNSNYDLGCLLLLAKTDRIKWNIDTHFKYDTLILAKLWNQNFFSYGLDHLSKTLLENEKKSDLLHDFAWSTGLYQDHKRAATGRNVHTRPSEAVLDKFCKSNMTLLPTEIIGEYAIGDVLATTELFEFLMPKLAEDCQRGLDLELYSDLQSICVMSKVKGVRVDLKKAGEVQAEFRAKAEQAAINICMKSGKGDLNINSTKQLAEVLIKDGHKLPLTEKGNYSVNKEVLESLTGYLPECILYYRQATKMKRDFVDKIINYQQAVPEAYRDDNIGIMLPTMKILGATTTGRFSSGGGTGCLEVNIQQIPTRNKEFGAPCRSLFIPHEGETWGYSDFSSQESRLQVHYAKLLDCDGVDEVVEAWNHNPDMSFHSKVSEMVGIEKDLAKTINLGLSYGMGAQKLYRSLGASDREGQDILRQYHELLPFMQQLQKKASSGIKTNKYIKTIGGRKLVMGKGKGAEKDGLSKLIQGSAADQAKRAMQLCYNEGLNILFLIHDELNISSSNIESDLPKLKQNMEEAISLIIPVVSDTGKGNSWLAAKQNSGE